SAATQGDIVTPGDTHNYTFTGAVGRRFYLANLGSDTGIAITLTAPDGAELDVSSGPFTLTEAGTYTLSVTGSQSGHYRFSLIDTAGSPQLALQAPVTGALDPSLGASLYQ